MDLRSSGQTERSVIPVPEEIHPESQRFLQLCDEIKKLHLDKAHDYGSRESALGNLDRTLNMGIHPLVGIFIRMGDKMARVESFVKKGRLVNEGIEINMRDIAVYALLAVVVWERQLGAAGLAAEAPRGSR